jgi:hypothetical protein
VYFARSLKRSDLENGNVFAHGSARLNLAPSDLATFVDPPDAALMFGFRALEAGDPFEKSFPVWMATLRRQKGTEAIVESLQRIFTQLADQPSLERLLMDLCDQARTLGYTKVWLAAGVLKEPLVFPSLKTVVAHLGRPVEMNMTTGMCALALSG